MIKTRVRTKTKNRGAMSSKLINSLIHFRLILITKVMNAIESTLSSCFFISVSSLQQLGEGNLSEDFTFFQKQKSKDKDHPLMSRSLSLRIDFLHINHDITIPGGQHHGCKY